MPFYAIDIGNTKIKVGKFEDERLTEKKEFQLIEAFYNYYSNQNIEKSILSSVRNLKWDSSITPTPLMFSQETILPFNNHYTSKETLGNDRKALVAGAIKMFPDQSCLIIDTGTCITYDLVDNEKNYFGGAISPGLTMRYRALNQFTAKLPLLEFEDQEISLVGDSTDKSIQSGVFHGICAEIQGVISEYQQKNKNLKILFTGGDAKYFEKHLKAAIFALPNLQMEGLYHILRQND